jgi:hypothetical protein
MKYLPAFLILNLFGCGGAPNNIDPAFQPLYNQFVSNASQYGIDVSGNRGLTVQFATLEQIDSLGEVIGECSDIGYANNTISIDPGFWNVANATQQLILYFHESSHCMLAEGHLTNAAAIMYPVINSPVSYYTSQDWPQMLSELFSDDGDYTSTANNP